jgi:hypothetical protein
MRSFATVLFLVAPLFAIARAAEPDTKALVQQACKAAGGEDKLLKLFRYKEKLNVSSDPDQKANERTSVVEAPNYWWMNKKERVKEEKEPAIFLVWGWTLGAITEPKSKLETIPELKDGDRMIVGIRVSETVKPAMDLYFDQATHLLVRIDWRTDIHRFSVTKEHDGVKYPSKCIGYKKNTGKPWYFTEITEVERLKELPSGLKR